MKLLSILLTAILCATTSAQTIKTLGYNTTNGQVVYSGTNTLTFPTIINAEELAHSGDVAIQLANRELISEGQSVLGWGSNYVEFSQPITFAGTNAAPASRTNLGLGWSALTNTNVTNFRSAIGLGELNDPRFAALRIGDTNISFESTIEDDGINWYFNRGTNASEPAITIGYLSNSILTFLPIVFQSNSHAATTRTNLSLGLPALTNTSNVTMMRALSGSTNTNEPYSGSISVVGTNNTNTLVFSNGILQSVQ